MSATYFQMGWEDGQRKRTNTYSKDVNICWIQAVRLGGYCTVVSVVLYNWKFVRWGSEVEWLASSYVQFCLLTSLCLLLFGDNLRDWKQLFCLTLVKEASAAVWTVHVGVWPLLSVCCCSVCLAVAIPSSNLRSVNASWSLPPAC